MKTAFAFLCAFMSVALAVNGQITSSRLVRPAQRAIDARNARNAQYMSDRPSPGPQPGQQSGGSAGPSTNTLVSGYLLIKTLDTNNDGIIDAAEINNAPEALKALDVNKDGKLTVDEYTATGEPRPCYSPILKALDLNENGVIDPKEIEGAAASLRMLDKNFDGKLAANEYRPSATAAAAAASSATTKTSAPPQQ